MCPQAIPEADRCGAGIPASPERLADEVHPVRIAAWLPEAPQQEKEALLQEALRPQVAGARLLPAVPRMEQARLTVQRLAAARAVHPEEFHRVAVCHRAHPEPRAVRSAAALQQVRSVLEVVRSMLEERPVQVRFSVAVLPLAAEQPVARQPEVAA